MSTTKQPDLFDAEEIEKCVRKPKPRNDWFLVIAYNLVNGYWSERGAPWNTLVAAQTEVEKLSSVWGHVSIVRIPGTGKTS